MTAMHTCAHARTKQLEGCLSPLNKDGDVLGTSESTKTVKPTGVHEPMKRHARLKSMPARSPCGEQFILHAFQLLCSAASSR